MNNLESHDQKSVFDEKFGELIQKTRQLLTEQKLRPEEVTEAEKSINVAEEYIPKILDDESKEALTALPIDDFRIAVGNITHHFREEDIPLENAPTLSQKEMKNILLYIKVRGYGHPDLIKRQKENPTPTAQEILLGCYKEQIEEQTRTAVLTMRSKGYQTVESGFEPHQIATGAQYFHLKEENQTLVPNELIREMQRNFDVTITTDRHKDNTHIIFTPKRYKDIKEWEKCMNYFADHMPIQGKERPSLVGGSVKFLEKIIKTFSKDTILKTATTDRQRELIKQLYTCKTEDDVLTFSGIKKTDYYSNNQS